MTTPRAGARRVRSDAWTVALLVALTTTSAVAAGSDEPVPWPTGQPPDPTELGEALHSALERASLETQEELLEAAEKGEDREHITVFQDDIDRGRWDNPHLFAFGDALFSHEFRAAEGFAASGATTPLRRVHAGVRGGLDTFSCAGCHSVGGPDGAGSLTQNALLEGDGERASTAIERNAPAVLGLGFVEALGVEMTAALQAQRAAARWKAVSEGQATVELVAKGVPFGVFRIDAFGVEDTTGIVGVAPDLEVRPFGWKGTESHLRRFVEDAARVHFGIQSTVLADRHRTSPDPARLGPGPAWFDPDADGVSRELEEGTLTAGAVYLAMLESPVVLPPHDAKLRERWAEGSALFDKVKCSSCHTRELPLVTEVVRERPDTTGGPGVLVNLYTDGDTPKVSTRVGLFSDLKRHDMGAELADPHENASGVPRAVFLTRPLWGLAETAPYLHDGRAATIPEAILAHGGEALASRAAFLDLSEAERASLHVFLLSLTRAPKPRVAR